MRWAETVFWWLLAAAVPATVWALAWREVRLAQVDATRPVRCDCGDGPDDDDDDLDDDPPDLDRYGVDRDWAPAQRSDR
jgi:hypothetical protein